MAYDLGKSADEWRGLLGRRLGEGIICPLRLLRETADRFLRQRTQVINLGDYASATPHITAVTLSGVNYGVNTTVAGYLYVRITANASNWDVKLYMATGGGAGDLVAQATNVAAGAQGTLVAQNSSGLSGTVTLGATVTADTSDDHQLYVVVDFPARLRNIYDESETDDVHSREAVADFYSALGRGILSLMEVEGRRVLQRFLLTDGEDNPVAYGNEFLQGGDTTLYTDTPQNDGSGNISRLRIGVFVTARLAMEGETTGGEQDVVRIVPSASAATFTGDGSGSIAAFTPGEAAPVGRVTLTCVRGVDTGHLGQEQFQGRFVSTDGKDVRFTFDAPVTVGKDYTAQRDIGTFRIERSPSKTGDGSNLNLAAVSGASVSGETNDYTDNGVLYWQVDQNSGGTNWDISFFSASSRASDKLVAKATNIATGAAFTATEQNNSGITVAWTVGSGPSDGAQGTLDLNPFYAENTSGVPDKITFEITRAANPGLYQSILADVFRTRLNSDTSGSETISDDYVKQGTFVPFLSLDN